MSITLYSGTPGSYKSYHAVCHAIDDICFGRNVIANFPMDFKPVHIKQRGLYEYWANSKITPDNLLKFAQEHHKKSYNAQTVVIIDEASTMFNARDFGRSDRLAWINFFANHRHFNFDFILITQSDKMLDKQIRGLIEQEIRHRAISNYNFFTFLLSKFVRGIYATVEYWYPCRMRNGGTFHKFNKKKASCYDTMALFIDNPNELNKLEQSKKNSKVVIINAEAPSVAAQREQNVPAAVSIGGVNYDINTGISTVAGNKS